MTTIEPSDIFRVYIKGLLEAQISKPNPIGIGALERRLWDAASFDSYIISRNSLPLRDEQGNPSEEASAYAVLIDAAKLEHIKGMEER